MAVDPTPGGVAVEFCRYLRGFFAFTANRVFRVAVNAAGSRGSNAAAWERGKRIDKGENVLTFLDVPAATTIYRHARPFPCKGMTVMAANRASAGRQTVITTEKD